MARAQLIIEQLAACGITHVVTLPDNTSRVLLEKLAGHPAIRVVSTTREGEAWAIAAGIWIGGGMPAMLIQNTGFFESGDALRGTAMRMCIPLLCLLTYRGYSTLSRLETPPATPLDARVLGRPDVDSCAVMFEPTLQAWGVPYHFLHDDADVSKIRSVFDQAHERAHPVALLLTRETT